MKKNIAVLIILVSIILPLATIASELTLERIRVELASLQRQVNSLASILLAVKPDDTGKPAETPGNGPESAQTQKGATPGTPAEQASETASEASAGNSAQQDSGNQTSSEAGSSGGGGGVSYGQSEQAQSSGGAGSAVGAIQVETTAPSKADKQEPKQKSEPKVEISTPQPVTLPEAPRILNLSRGLRNAAQGDDVKAVQELLAKFPEIYPRGLVTGFFGPLSSQAVKNFQEKLGLEQVGTIGPETRRGLEALATAIGRKGRPHIDDISPSAVSAGTEIFLSGQGFTFEENAILVKGKLIQKNIFSLDGTTISFFVEVSIPCEVEAACPIKVINANGISNAKPFKLSAANSALEPEPEPVITPPIVVPAVPEINAISPAYGGQGTEITLFGTGFSATGNAVNLGDTLKAVTDLVSDGVTLKFTLPASVCLPLTACPVSITNGGGTSNIVNFTLTQPITPVVIKSPNGGEKLLQGSVSNLVWTGGTDIVRLALVEGLAVPGIDPSPYIVGWLGLNASPNSSFSWNGKEVCDEAQTLCAGVTPAEYKILAISENELGQVTIGSDATGNWDLSDQPFSLMPAPILTVLAPNGGEKIISGATTTITWQATSILSKTVKINLLKSGSLYKTLANDVAQDADTGLFIYSWLPGSDIPIGNDYSIDIVDALNPLVKDTSDAPFSIALKSSLTLVKPNGSEALFKGFQMVVRWNAGNIVSQSVNIDLYGGGVAMRRLASNVPQKFYSWSSQTYSSGTGFNYTLTIPLDLPDGSDYQLVISDAADSSASDISDATFSIQTIPNPVNISGRLINRFTNNALAGTRLYLDGGWRYANTGSNGEFTVSTSTASLSNASILGSRMAMPVGSWPNCYMNWRYDIFTNTEYPYWRDHVFDLSPDRTGTFNQGTINLGDVPMWPGTSIYVYSDNPNISNSAQVNYPDSGYSGFQVLALETDLQVKIYNTATRVSLPAPSIRIPLTNGCAPKALTYLADTFKWEPYIVRSNVYLASPTVGSALKATIGTSGGVGPYSYGLYVGNLPPGLTLDSANGVISGTPTALGTYNFTIKTTDSAGVNGGSPQITVTVK